jgi:ribosome recycling factor
MINVMEQAAILITIYDKSDAESISKEHIKEIISRNGFG